MMTIGPRVVAGAVSAASAICDGVIEMGQRLWSPCLGLNAPLCLTGG
jgi:hypothetical protein